MSNDFGNSSAHDFLCILPDFERIVLHPAGLGVDLLMLFLVYSNHMPAVIEDHAAGAGGALVNGGNVSGHNHLPEEDRSIVYQNSRQRREKG